MHSSPDRVAGSLGHGRRMHLPKSGPVTLQRPSDPEGEVDVPIAGQGLTDRIAAGRTKSREKSRLLRCRGLGAHVTGATVADGRLFVLGCDSVSIRLSCGRNDSGPSPVSITHYLSRTLHAF